MFGNGNLFKQVPMSTFANAFFFTQSIHLWMDNSNEKLSIY